MFKREPGLLQGRESKEGCLREHFRISPTFLYLDFSVNKNPSAIRESLALLFILLYPYQNILILCWPPFSESSTSLGWGLSFPISKMLRIYISKVYVLRVWGFYQLKSKEYMGQGLSSVTSSDPAFVRE